MSINISEVSSSSYTMLKNTFRQNKRKDNAILAFTDREQPPTFSQLLDLWCRRAESNVGTKCHIKNM